jgi:amino acid adenylation domain-containing protein
MMYREYTDMLTIAADENRKEREYWLKNLEGDLVKTAFPYNQNKKEITALKTEPAAKTIKFRLTDSLISRLMKLGKGVDHTLHMILVTGWVLLLEKYTGNKDIIVGTTIYKQKQGIDSALINTVLVLRCRLSDTMTFKELLLHVREIILKANENQNYPLEVLLEELNMPLSEDDSPLFDCVVLLENIHYRGYLSPIKPNMVITFLRANETHNNDVFIEGNLEYNVLLYKDTSIERIVEHFNQLMTNALSFPDTHLTDIDMISDEEKHQLLVEFNNTGSGFPNDKTIHALFEEQVERTPDHIAIEGTHELHKLHEFFITYNELNRKSNQLAHLLREKGVRIDTIVAVMMEPSLELAIAVMGILKAGGAFSPVDTQYPEKRIQAILDDSGIPLLLMLNRETVSGNIHVTSLENIHPNMVTPIVTAPRLQIKDFDSLPIPDRSLVNYEKIHHSIGCAMARHTVSLQASRGCPFNCAYCHKIWPKSHIVRSAENIFEEIRYCYEAGARRFTFIDDVFNLNKKNTTRLFRKIIQHGLHVQMFFPNGLRGDILDKETIDLMVEAGAVDIGMALESASPRIQKLINKNLNLEKFSEIIQYITRKYPWIILELEMMVGFPTETEEEALMTLDYLKNLKWVHFPNLHILKIYQNTDMYRLAVENGISPERIDRSAALAYHQLPDTLPFPKRFARELQSRFLNEYILNKERLLTLLPFQMKILSEAELVEKYNSYLPMEIKSFYDLLNAAGITRGELEDADLMQHEPCAAPEFTRLMKEKSQQCRTDKKPGHYDSFRILLMDLSQLFEKEAGSMLYDVVEEPLGLMYLMTYLNRTFGTSIQGKVIKSRVDFENYNELKELILQFKPDLIGIRTLTFYKEFFHRTVSVMRHWGVDVPIAAGGPYATSDYNLVLMDHQVDLAVLGEGELTLKELVERMMANEKKLPASEELREINGIAFVNPADRKLLKTRNREILFLDSFFVQLENFPKENPRHINGPGDLLYVISTSGSTGKPKGIMLEHRTMVNLVYFQFTKTAVDFSGNVLQFASPAFDISPQEVFCTLLSGGRLYPVSSDMKGDIPRFLEFLEINRISIAFLPPAFLKFIFSEFDYAEKFSASVRHIIAAGEKLVVTESFRQYLKNSRVYLHNHYGPAETHVVTTLTLYPGENIPEFPSIGGPISNTGIYILDPHNKPIPIGLSGELYIAGTAVGRGYLNRPELTTEKFNHDLWDYQEYQEEKKKDNEKFLGVQGPFFKKVPGRRRLYKTGDLARWLQDGNIEFLGRVDYQVKIRGFRIELREIERQLMNIKGIKEAVVIDHEDSRGDKSLCAYIVADVDSVETPTGTKLEAAEKTTDNKELRDYLSLILPDFMVPSYFMQIERIPLTFNGKVNRKSLPQPELKNGESYTPPTNHIERKLVEIWSEILGRDSGVLPASIGIDDNFFDLGGHSLKATVMIARTHKELSVKVPLGEIFKMPTIRALALYIMAAEKEFYISIESIERKEYYPASSAQKRMYIIDQLKLENTSDNTPDVVTVNGPLRKSRLEGVVQTLIERHEPLRTSFHLVDDEPVQKVYDTVEFEIEYSSLKQGVAPPTIKGVESIEQSIQDFIRPFELSRPPLLRVGLVKLEEEKHLLMYDMHHIIKDGSSSGIFIREFMYHYEGSSLPEPRLQYRDFTAWQNRMLQEGGMKKQEEFWLNVFSGDIPQLEMPTDFPRPAHQSFEGDCIDFYMNAGETAKIKTAAAEMDATLYMVLLSIYNILLSKYFGQEDIVVGTPAAGRPHADLENMIGMFVNTLAMRSRPRGEKTFRQFLEEVKANSLKAFENQDYQFDMLVNRLGIQPDPSRQSLFDTMFAVHDMSFIKGSAGRKIKDLEFESYPFENNITQFDIVVHAVEERGIIAFRLLYCTKLFKRETIEMFVECYKEVASIVLENTSIQLKDIAISHRLAAAETHMPAVEFVL